MTIESIIGSLQGTYKRLQPDSILHVDKLMTERRENKELREQSFYTADGELYFLRGKKQTPMLAMTRGDVNPLFQDTTIDTYCEELRQNRNYRPKLKEFQRAVKAKDTVLIDLTKLHLSKGDDEWGYLAIDPARLKALNAEERTLAVRVYGPRKEFDANMKCLLMLALQKKQEFMC